jgi:xylulose-5-phosphate/fructose-6-phosphate phosphoketolase
MSTIKDEPNSPTEPLEPEQLRPLNAWWRAANYLSVGQVYLLANPSLREPLKIEHVKPRLLGHYVHLNRTIMVRDHNVLSIAGPGHGAPDAVADDDAL